MTTHVDHVVVGGGVMGAAAAWELARRGREVVLLERFEPGHARGASHGSSRIYRTTYAAPEYLDLAQEAFFLWRELEDEAGAPGDVLTLTGGVSQGGPELGGVADAFAARGVPHAWLRAAEASERWPGLRFEGDVLHEPATAGRLHADRAVAAFLGAATARGAVVRHRTPVLRLEARASGVDVHTGGEVLRARSVVLAAGAWTSVLAPGGTGDGVVVDPDEDGTDPLRAVARGLPALVVTQEQPAHFALRAGAPDAASWPVFTHQPAPPHPWPSGTYGLVSPQDGVKVGFHGVGPVTDPDRRTFAPEPRQLAQLQDYVRRWVPGADPDRLEPISCTYTTTPDHDFVLDRRGRVVVAAGFSGHGFKFAPAIGRVLADLATEEPDAPSAVPARFALGRPAAAVARP